MNKLFATALAVAFAKAQTIQGSVVCVYSAADFIPESVTWTLITESRGFPLTFELTADYGQCSYLWGSEGQIFDN